MSFVLVFREDHPRFVDDVQAMSGGDLLRRLPGPASPDSPQPCQPALARNPAIPLAASRAAVTLRSRITAAFDIHDDGSLVFEIGRAETGATCVLVEEGPARFTLRLPLMRTPTSARDLLPTAFFAAARARLWLGADDDDTPPSLDELLARWDRQHRDAAHRLAALCAAQGLPLPPHLPRAELEALHGWLISSAAARDVPHPILALDPADGRPAIPVVRLPRVEERARCRLPPFPGVLADLAATGDVEAPALYPMSAIGGEVDADGFWVIDVARARAILDDVPGEPLARYRIIAPVEIVDAESFA